MMKKMFALVLMLCLFALPAFALAATQEVSYVDREWDGNRVVESTKTAAATVIENEMKDLSSGWYVVTGDVTVSERMMVADGAQVHLILADGCLLTANMGIRVPEGSSLTIYAQSSDEETMGKLVATGGKISPNYCAGIGGGSHENCGDITINGGNVKATGACATSGSHQSETGAGIGAGGSEKTASDFSSIVINGGIVNAYATQRGSSAIGTSNRSGRGNRIEINGGTVLAYAHYQGAIGAYEAKVMVRGGTLISYGNASICVVEGDITISDAEIIPYKTYYDTATIRNYDKNGTISISNSVVKVPVAGSGTVNVTNSILFERVNIGGQGYYHGYLSDDSKSFTLEDDLVIEEKETLHVREGEKLTIPAGVTLKVIGDMLVTGTIVVNGNGKLDCRKANTHPVKEYSVTNSVPDGPDDTLKFTCYCGETQSYTLHVPQKVYDGKYERATYTVSPEGVLLFGAPKGLEGYYGSAGTHTVTLTVAGRSLTRAFTIEKAIPTEVTFPTASPITYGQKLSESVLSGGTEGVAFEWTDKNTVPPVANSGYPVRYKPEDTKNYDYSGIEGWDGAQYVERNVAIAVAKAVPRSSDFDFIEPEPDDEDDYELFYDGTKKSAFVKPDIDAKGMGEITLIYCDEQGNPINESPIDAGTYTVKINVAEGENYTEVEGVTSKWWKFTINPIDPTFARPENLTATYGDTLSDVSLPTEENGTWAWEECDALVGDAGQQIHLATFTPNDTRNYNTIAGVELPVTVHKAAPAVTAPTANALTYTGSAQTLVTAGSVTGGTLVYSLDGAAYAETLPTAVDAGTYTVFYQVIGDSNHLDTEPQTLTANIAKAEPALTTPTANALTYTGSAQTLVTAGSVTGGTLVYSLDGAAYAETLPTAVDAGAYTVYYQVIGDSNHNDTAAQTITVIIVNADSALTAPTANTLTYTGSAQTLITAGSAAGGKMVYSLDGAAYAEALPTAVDAGVYTVYYQVIGDSNHNDTAAQTITVTIAKADPALTAPTANALTYTGSAQTLITAGSVTGGTLVYSLDGVTYAEALPTAVDAGAYAVFYQVIGDSNHNDTAAQTITVTIAKAQIPAPTGLTAAYSQMLAQVALPEGWTWVNPDTAVGNAGENTHKANYAGDDNYLPAADVPVMVSVSQSATSMTAELMDNKREYTYGEQVNIAVTPAAAGAVTFRLRRFAAPKAGQVSLWNGSEQIAEPQNAGNGETVTFALDTVADGLTPGSYTLTAKYTATGDMAAQETTVSFSVNFAEDTPENDAEVSGDKNEEGWSSDDPVLTAPEGGKVSLGCGEDAPWRDSLALPDAEGKHTYTYYVKDEDGHIAEKNVTVMVDKTAPTVEEIDIQPGATGAEITAPATDELSGVLDYQLTQNSGKEKLTIMSNGGGSFTIEGMAPGKAYDLTLTVRDMVGNTATVTITVTAAQLPQTGDNSSLGLWLMLLSAAGAGMLTLRRKAHN